MKTAIYTAIIGDYDTFIEPRFIDKEYDYILFTDQDNIVSPSHRIIKIKDESLDSTRLARKIKILPYLFLPDYDYTIWHDANIVQQKSIKELVDSVKSDWFIMKHPMNTCVYQEAELCKRLGKDNSEIIDAQMDKYKDEGYPANNGMVASGIIFRKNTKKVNRLGRNWFNEVKEHSKRDQLSFNYALRKIDISIEYTEYNTILQNEFKIEKLHKNYGK